MQDLPSPALCLLVTNTAIFIRWYAAEVLGVVVGDGGAVTDAEEAIVCTNVPAHVVTGITIIIFMGALHIVVADDLTLGVGGVGWTVLWTLVVTRF